ncbi:MAG TPA: restriction endonuclease subunit S [Runella sp.]|nr:restriction endonuclease subunit S [Runella sp.]
MQTNLPAYTHYKPSGVQWLGDIPEHWEVTKLKFLAKIQNGQDYKHVEADTGYPVYGSGGVFKYSTNYIYKKPSVLLGRKGTVDTPLFVIEPFWTVDTMFYTEINENVNAKFFYYLCLQIPFNLLQSGSTIPSMTQFDLGNNKLCSPPLPEQTAIAQFLDRKTALIDKAIGLKEKQIELLKERRQILIHQAVTRGLNPDVPMKDSGIEWIGEIPEHWEVKRAKFLFDEIDERSLTGNEELLSVSHMTGVTPRSEKNVSMFMSEDYTGSKLCRRDDLIYNIMWAWMGALGVSDRTGIVSPSYAIYRQKKAESLNPWYFEQLLKDPNYVAHYNRVSTGLHSSRLRFYSNMFFDMKIGFPPIEEQNRIVEYLKTATQKIDKAIGLKEQEIEKLKEYKASLINSMVTGKVKVVE